ncbi:MULTISPECIES: flagella biosynthesis regulatory protein FliT [unclassified Erwinia]|uniref:flagella biosynthesis regulatory protein FliT n=1 Tax=unclassified Erwinia TaxID=2622719 RepID=UPI00082AD04F|nr:flagella biosynthesis regulatory protein FliT [Erwinia sp. ErVv1]
MNIAPHMFGIYQQLLVISQSMLRLASEGKWDELIDTEVNYVSTVEKLAETTRDVAIPAQTLDQLRPVLRHILDNEAEVKRMLQHRMGELADLIGQNTRQKSVNSAYGKLSGVVLFPHQST